MKGAAEFYADWLTPNAEGYLVTPISTSPENKYITKDRKIVSITDGPTMDLAIIRELFARTIEASKLLNTDPGLRKELENKLDKNTPLSNWQTWPTPGVAKRLRRKRPTPPPRLPPLRPPPIRSNHPTKNPRSF